MGTISLSDALAAPSRSGRMMRVDELLESDELDKADRVTFANAVRDPNVRSGRIEGAMRTLGIKCSGTAITNWRQANGVKVSASA